MHCEDKHYTQDLFKYKFQNNTLQWRQCVLILTDHLGSVT